jgi:hypothetical protein
MWTLVRKKSIPPRSAAYILAIQRIAEGIAMKGTREYFHELEN